jgi:hypothetical protein
VPKEGKLSYLNIFVEEQIGGVYSIKLKGVEFEHAKSRLKGKYEFMKMGNKEAFGEL